MNTFSGERILYVRLPCNPIFPIGVVYLADHVHKLFPDVEQEIFDLGALPPLDFKQALDDRIVEFRPSLLVFSWRDIQIYAPVGGRAGNPLQNSFQVLFSENLLERLQGAVGSLRMFTDYYGELWRNLGLIRRGYAMARAINRRARVIVGGGAISVFYEQLAHQLPRGTIVSVGEGETLFEKLLRGEDISTERCYVAGVEPPRARLLHEQPTPVVKTACDYDYIERIWPQFDYYLDGDFYIGVQTKRGCPHNCIYCIYTVVEGKQVRVNPAREVVSEMRQLYERGVRNFWFTDAQFVPSKKYIADCIELLRAIQDSGMEDIHWAGYIRADNLPPDLTRLMVETGMNYFEIGITSGSQSLVRKMRLGYNLRTVLENCRSLKESGFDDLVSVNYSFNVIGETDQTIRETIAFHRELESIFGREQVEPAIFFIGLQPHTGLEAYAFQNKVLKPGYDPMSLMPWTATKVLWNPGPMGAFFGRICLEAWSDNPEDFGRAVMDALEKKLGRAQLHEALSAPLAV